MGHQHFDSLDLLQTRSAQVRALALCLVRDAATADDLVQDALTKALRRPASVTGDWRAWISVTLRNLVRDSAREASRREGRELRAAEAARDATALNSDAESTVERAEPQRLVVDEVLALDEVHRTVILLHDLDGLGLAEVARRLGITSDAAKKRRQRALVLLRARLESRLGPDGRWAVALLPVCGSRELCGLPNRALRTTLMMAAPLALVGGIFVLHELTSSATPKEQKQVVHAPKALSRVEDSVAALDAPPSPAIRLEPEPEHAAQGPAVSAADVDVAQETTPEAILASPPPEVLLELVWIPSGIACVGSTDHEILQLLAKWPNYVRVLDAQRPQHRVELPGFFLSRTEVTNGQYLTFVVATDRCPPLRWADPEAVARAAAEAGARTESVARAAAEFARDEERIQSEMQAVGLAYEKRAWTAPLDSSGFFRDSWWISHWRETPWSIPTGEETLPVIFVDCDDAAAYCAWAQGRLPTEFEFQRAARGAEALEFPFGEFFDPDRAVTAEQKRTKSAPVGSHPGAASAFGILDLAGNVWEWTSSPYVAYPGYTSRDFDVTIQGRTETRRPNASWDPAMRVVVSGDFMNEALAARVATRRGTGRDQRTGALGFRLARSGPPE